MLKQNPIKSYIVIAERCLTNYWGKKDTYSLREGWDTGSPAHRWTLRWAKMNFLSLKKLQWNQIYKQYQKLLIQE